MDNPTLDYNPAATIDDAVAVLMTELSEQGKRDLRAMPHSDLIGLHVSYGRYIRNKFGLWQHNQALLRDAGHTDMSMTARHEAADDTSQQIIERLWAFLKDNVNTPGLGGQS